MDNVLVTGGAGFVGTALAMGIKAQHPGCGILALDNLKRRGSELNLPRLRDAGFRLERCDVIPLVNTTLHPHTYSFGILAAIQGFVAERGDMTKAEAEAWAKELRELADAGRYFFSINRYLFGARKPEGGPH